MTPFARKLVFSTAVICLSLALGTTPAHARAHHKHHVVHHATRHAARHASGNSIVRIAQQQLYDLGYYNGNIDGIMGPGTRAAIKKFQREHGLKADGVLGRRTNNALAQADRGPHVLGTHSIPMMQVGSGGDNAPATNSDYAVSLSGGTKALSSRFARIDIAESGSGYNKRYNVNVNGQPILIADGQPSVIGVSQSFDLGDEDAVIFTTYSPDESGCIYRNHVLAMSGAGTKLLDIDNCTRQYDAVAKNGSLFITFPQHDSNSALGSGWRLEGFNLVRL